MPNPPPFPDLSAVTHTMRADVYREKANKANEKECKVILMMIDEAAEKGQYAIMVDQDMVTQNKITYLRHLGFTVYDLTPNQKKYSISFQ